MGSRQARQRPPRGPTPGHGPHLSDSCLPATRPGSGSVPAGHSALRSGTAAGIWLWGVSLRRGPGGGRGSRKGCRAARGGAGGGLEGEEVLSRGRGRAGSGCLTCSAGPGEPAGPRPAGAAGVARPGGGRPGAAAVGSLVDGSGERGGREGSSEGPALTGWPPRLLPGLLPSWAEPPGATPAVSPVDRPPLGPRSRSPGQREGHAQPRPALCGAGGLRRQEAAVSAQGGRPYCRGGWGPERRGAGQCRTRWAPRFAGVRPAPLPPSLSGAVSTEPRHQARPAARGGPGLGSGPDSGQVFKAHLQRRERDACPPPATGTGRPVGTDTPSRGAHGAVRARGAHGSPEGRTWAPEAVSPRGQNLNQRCPGGGG